MLAAREKPLRHPLPLSGTQDAESVPLPGSPDLAFPLFRGTGIAQKPYVFPIFKSFIWRSRSAEPAAQIPAAPTGKLRHGWMHRLHPHALHPHAPHPRRAMGSTGGQRALHPLPHAGSSAATSGSADVSQDPAAPVPGAAGRGDAAHGGGQI